MRRTLPATLATLETSSVANALDARMGFSTPASGSSTDCKILLYLSASIYGSHRAGSAHSQASSHHRQRRADRAGFSRRETLAKPLTNFIGRGRQQWGLVHGNPLHGRFRQ
jgi:hypothetical protein